jgi:phytoene synthase
LFDIDDAMADVVAHSTQPALGAIKLAWWRERLEELDEGKVPAEPRLQAAAELLSRGISGSQLARLEDGWTAMLEEHPDADRVAAGFELPFEFGAVLLDVKFGFLHAAGQVVAGMRIARSGLRDMPAKLPSLEGKVSPRHARPLTAFAALAMRDLHRGGPPFEREGTPGRALTLMRHRLTGRFPR